MKYQEFCDRVSDMNDHLYNFHGVSTEFNLKEDNIDNILKFLVPNHWARHTLLHGLVILNNNLHEKLDFEHLNKGENIYKGMSIPTLPKF